ncbi:MAG: protein kinase [Planctomycetales bacterium]|nr:protein kinase [Planctomycetales bacterium]
MADDESPDDDGRDALSLVPDLYEQLGDLADRFVAAWERTHRPPLADYVPESGPLRQLALVELIKIDLEFNWIGAGDPRYIDDYLREFPELAREGIPSDLIYEEFHLRREAGLQVDPTEYLERFPENAAQLRRLMSLDEPTSTTSMMQGRKHELLSRLQPGDTIDDFQLLTLLGKGSFASVYLARQNSMQRLVALKVSVQASAEPQTLGQFDNDYIVRVYDQRVLPEQNLHLLYMQYIPGGSLDDVLKQLRDMSPAERTGRDFVKAIDTLLDLRGESGSADSPLRKQLSALSWPQTVGWLASRLALALDYACCRGVLHRDVKPANVLLTPDGVPKLADFNVSCCSKLDGASPGAFFGGSLAYMSPEQLQACNPANEREPDSLDGRSDVYSLAVMTWELLTGTRPFADPAFNGNWSDVLLKLEQSRQAPPAIKMETTNHVGLYRVLQRALAPAREDRWESGRSFARQLELSTDSQCEPYLQPAKASWRVGVRPYLFWLILAATVLPSIFAALVNFTYNHQHIIAGMPKQAERHFMFVQTVTNAIAFPVGLFVMGWLVRSTASPAAPVGNHPQDCGNVLRFGRYAAWICVVLWTLAGLTYPLSMRVGGFEMPISTSGHFFFSLVLCGLFAVSLNFFGVTALSLRVAIPALWERCLSMPDVRPQLAPLTRSCWLYLSMSAAVPMVTTTALVSGNQGDIRSYLIVTSLAGAAAFVLASYLFRLISRDIETLKRIGDIVGGRE